jgi:hypothetical protein
MGRIRGIPILGVIPSGGQRIPEVVEDSGCPIVGWRRNSVLGAIRALALVQARPTSTRSKRTRYSSHEECTWPWLLPPSGGYGEAIHSPTIGPWRCCNKQGPRGARGSSRCAIFERRRISVCHNPSSHGQGIITQCAKDIGYSTPPPLPQSGSKAYLYVVTRTADIAGKLAVCAYSSSAVHLGCARETSISSQIIPPP